MEAETFIRIWMTSHSLEEVALKTGLSKRIASSRASVLRAQGVALKQFKRGKPRDLEALRKLAQELS